MKEYTEAIGDLKSQLSSEREDKQQLMSAYKRRKTQMQEEAAGGTSGSEALRLKSALVFSQQQLKAERHREWKGRWQAAVSRGSGAAAAPQGSAAVTQLQNVLGQAGAAASAVTPAACCPLPVMRLSSRGSGTSAYPELSAAKQLHAALSGHQQRVGGLVSAFSALQVTCSGDGATRGAPTARCAA